MGLHRWGVADMGSGRPRPAWFQLQRVQVRTGWFCSALLSQLLRIHNAAAIGNNEELLVAIGGCRIKQGGSSVSPGSRMDRQPARQRTAGRYPDPVRSTSTFWASYGTEYAVPSTSTGMSPGSAPAYSGTIAISNARTTDFLINADWTWQIQLKKCDMRGSASISLLSESE